MISVGFLALAVFMRFFTFTAPPLALDVPLGVWWWQDNASSTLLDFAQTNGVDEIYYCDSALDQDTASFVARANAKGMNVYLLTGECDWILDKSSLDNLLDRYRAYQVAHPESNLAGVHLDVEPHQLDDFGERRAEYLTLYAEFVYNVVVENPDISFDFDIPFWFDDQISLLGDTKPLYQHVFDWANRVFVMSYRDSVDKIISCAQDELAYAGVVGTPIFLSVETKPNDNGSITFYQEGKIALAEVLNSLDERVIDDFGISIHHIESWYQLKEC